MQNKKAAVLCVFNSKYIHTSLAARYIKAYADAHSETVNTVICEQTVNTDKDTALREIIRLMPDIAAFSCYIWNIDFILDVCEELKKSNPDIKIVLGGPEVSFNAEQYISLPFIDYVQCGDGEKAMTYLFDCIANGILPEKAYGICYEIGETKQLCQPYYEKNLDEIESPYTNEYIQAVNGRIAYIESTRGCPFSCAFCLSGADRGVRYFPEKMIKDSILKLWQSGAKTVKFIDRTFNANSAHAESIISFIIENSKQMPKNVCFHFEIAADILRDSTINLLSSAPKGLFQTEAGLQSFNAHTLEAVTRKTDTDKICSNMRKIISADNIHTHIDLIAGLPFEDYESFKNSFNKAYLVGAHMLQLGFLKLLHGSSLRKDAEKHDFVYSQKAPYEIQSTKWLTAHDIEKLHAVEDANEKISNSGRFKTSLGYVLEITGIPPFDLFLGFGKRKSMPLDEYTSEVFVYFSKLPGVDKATLRDKMCIDRLKSNTSAKLPDCLKIYDRRLARITHILGSLSETKPEPGTKRAVCILYTQDMVVYEDYPANKADADYETELKYIPLESFFKEEEQ